MEDSILKCVKQILGLSLEEDPFDLDVLIHINSTLSSLSQMGVGAEDSEMVVDDTAEWADLDLPDNQLKLVKSYVPLKVQTLWDPPTTSYLIEAREKQLQEMEWRLNVMREEALANVE